MEHPFNKLRAEYSQLLSLMVIRPECVERVNRTATQILGYRSRFEEVSRINGVPAIFIGATFYREASLDFSRNPAQGWPLKSRSKDIPHNGPFPDWKSAALAAYRLNGLDLIGPLNWSWELMCFYGEAFNGFGYRDVHKMHSPYLWGGTNIQAIGKYTEDRSFDPTKWDVQIGIIPLMRRLAEIMPELQIVTPIPVPSTSGLAVSQNAAHNVTWLQTALRDLGFDVRVDGSYGRQTKHAVRLFQTEYNIRVDGYAGPETLGALEQALRELRKEEPLSLPAPAPALLEAPGVG